MKSVSRFIVFVGVLAFGQLAQPATAIAKQVSSNQVLNIVKDEKKIEKESLQVKMTEQKIILSKLSDDEKKVRSRLKRMAAWEKKALEIFGEYVTLLKVRYVNDNGDHVPGLVLIDRDVENINTIFSKYLKQAPLTGRVSAGQAVSSLEKGQDILSDRIALHEGPDSGNNSEIEIITTQIDQAQRRVEVVTVLAGQMGFKLDTKVTDKMVSNWKKANPDDKKSDAVVAEEPNEPVPVAAPTRVPAGKKN